MSVHKVLVYDVFQNALGIIPEASASCVPIASQNHIGTICVYDDSKSTDESEHSNIKVKDIIANVIFGEETQKENVPESSVINGITSIFPGIIATSQLGLNKASYPSNTSHNISDGECEHESKNSINTTKTLSEEILRKEKYGNDISSRCNEDTKYSRTESTTLIQCQERICDQVVHTNSNSSKITQNNNIIRDDEESDVFLEEGYDSITNVSPKISPKVPPLLRSQSLPAYSERWPTTIMGASPTVSPAVSHSKALTHQSSVISEMPDSGLYSERLGTLPSEGTQSPKSIRSITKKKVMKTTDAARTTIMQHYYPEGGWGWVIVTIATIVQLLNHGLHTSYGVMVGIVITEFSQKPTIAGLLGAISTSVALLISPLTISVCRRKSTRLTAVLGGLITALGCLFTSFASQFHQLFFSYGAVIGIGVGLTRDSSTIMVGQYFKRRREFVEIIVVSGSGLGITVMSAFIRGAIGRIGWRLGLQAVTGVVFLTFLMGTFYRSASLYHPQRRAIVHLKNQKRKVKDKNRVDDRPPFFDTATLRSKTVQILLVSISLSSFGITTPIIFLAHQAEAEGIAEASVLMLQTYLGLGWVLGCCVFGFLVLQKNTECRVGRQYLCQASMFLCGVATLAFTAVKGYQGYVIFSWLYGIFSGGFHYSLKMYTYEKVRARNFARTWGFVQCSQAIPTAIGVPITGYINIGYGDKAGYYFSSTFVIFGSMTIFLIDIHRRNAARHKHSQKQGGGKEKTCVSETCGEGKRRDSLAQLDHEQLQQQLQQTAPLALLQQSSFYANLAEQCRIKPELTCISEEGIADMDLPDHLLDELEYLGDCITSCDKVENYLMMSEYENNLVKGTEKSDYPYITDRNGRRRLLSFSKRGSITNGSRSGEPLVSRLVSSRESGGALGVMLEHTFPTNQRNNLKSGNFRSITVIEEDSV